MLSLSPQFIWGCPSMGVPPKLAVFLWMAVIGWLVGTQWLDNPIYGNKFLCILPNWLRILFGWNLRASATWDRTGLNHNDLHHNNMLVEKGGTRARWCAEMCWLYVASDLTNSVLLCLGHPVYDASSTTSCDASCDSVCQWCHCERLRWSSVRLWVEKSVNIWISMICFVFASSPFDLHFRFRWSSVFGFRVFRRLRSDLWHCQPLQCQGPGAP